MTHLAPISTIVEAIAAELDVSEHRILGEERSRVATQARWVVFLLARDLLGASLHAIARVCGDRDHSTVRYALAQTDAMLAAGGPRAETWRALMDRVIARLETLGFEPPAHGITARSSPAAESRRRATARRCLCCDAVFASEHAGHRMCDACRPRASDCGEPYRVVR